MAKRRRVSNLLALAVLGVLVQRPMHPYEMASVLRARGKDQDMPIKWGSLYTVVGNLEKHGLLEAVESGRQGARPERTVYRITDAGREELLDWTRELVSTPEWEPNRFKAGLSTLGALPPDEVTELLRHRLAVLEHDLAERRAALERAATEIPRLFLVEDEYDLAIRDAEAGWIRALLAELTDGTFADLAMWRAFHDTGEMSPELAELAERGGTKD
jgi:DNA-binding PadR family transcriptional regulator